jgi:hypothetical protein
MVQFELAFGIEHRILRPAPLLRPLASADVGLMWMMESYSLRTTHLSEAPTKSSCCRMQQSGSYALQPLSIVRGT